MYVVNADELDISKLYHCSGIVANHLIYDAHLSVFGRCNKGGYYFVRSDKLREALKNMPYWMKVFSPKYP